MRVLSGSLVIAIILSVPVAQAQSERLVDLVANADEIFVGTLVQAIPVPEGMELAMTAERIIKGAVLPRSTVRAIFRPQNRREKEPIRFKPENGAFFLRRNASSPVYEILRGYPSGLSVMSTYIPLRELDPAPSVLPSSLQVIDRLCNELLASLNRHPDDIGLIQVIRTRLDVNQSPLVMATLRSWLGHSGRYLRVMAAAKLINTGDYDAASMLQAELKSSPKDPFVVSAGTAFAGLLDPDPRLVLIAGELSLDRSQAEDVRNAAVRALAAIHTKETLPFLYEHLKHPNQQVRQQAVDGFSKYVLGIPRMRDGNEAAKAMDEAVNPGRQQKNPRTICDTPETRASATFRQFSDKADEERRLQFWKTWYDTHRMALK